MGSYSEGLRYVANYERAKKLYRNSSDPNKNYLHMTLTQIAELTGLNADSMANMKEEVDEEIRKPFRQLSEREIELLTDFRKLHPNSQMAVIGIVKEMAKLTADLS